MKRWWMIMVLVLSSLLLAAPAAAQGGDIPIAYGDEVEGEITNAQFEVPYRFTGAEGDVVQAHMVVDESGDFYEPALILLDAENAVVASYEGWYEATLLTPLPADGDYVLLASRIGGRAGQGVGNYTLTLNVLTGLKPGEPAEDEMSNEDTMLYAVPTDAAFTLEFERLAGDFSPELTVKALDEYGDFQVIGVLYGNTFQKFTVVVEPDPDAPSDFYLIQLERSSWDWNYDTVTAQYRLTVTQ